MAREKLKDACILIIDDARPNLMVLDAALKHDGYRNLHMTSDPNQALPLFRSVQPDLVLLDLHMPQLDGFGVLAQLQPEIPPGAYLPIVVLTADDSSQAKQKALSGGAKDFLMKPFNTAEIYLRIHHLLETRFLYLQLQEQNRVLEERVRERTRDLETAQSELLAAAQEKKRFYREVIRAVTEDKFHLVEAEELTRDGEHVLHVSLEEEAGYSHLRKRLREVATTAGMEEQPIDDLVLGAGEAVTNAIKHAEGGRCDVYQTEEQLIVRVSDRGSGIQTEHLPASILTAGFSTKVSLGMGYTMMLRLVDRVWLATGPEGTVVQLAKSIKTPEPGEDDLMALLDRF